MITSSKLGIGPMSSQIVKSVFSYSDKTGVPLMLIASLNQINYKGGYVFNNSEFSENVSLMKKNYPKAEVYICRDHCGPGFSTDVDMETISDSINNDIASGYDLVHIDFSKYSNKLDEVLEVSKKAIENIQKISLKMNLEIGTDENTGGNFRNTDEIIKILNFFTPICKPLFFVIQTGSLIKEINQVGSFDEEYVKKAGSLVRKEGILIKEHNADYLGVDGIKKRNGLVDAVNNAPQFGVLQTVFTIQKALTYGLDISDFLEVSYQSKKWSKWLYKNTDSNAFLCSVIAGHYNFKTEAYKKLFGELCERENFEESLETEIHRLIDHYVKSL